MRGFERVVLWIAGLGFIGFGIAFLCWPLPTFRMTGIAIDGPVAAAELMAFYGGIELALGALLVATALYPARVRDGLVLTTAVYGTLALCRLAGMLLHGADTPFLRGALALEAVVAALAAFCLWQRR